MIKLTTIADLILINNKIKELENNEASQYCEPNYNANNSLIAIPISDFLRNLNLFPSEWFETDIINEMPSDWSWHFDKKQRLIIPAKLALTDFSDYINYVKTNPNLNYHIDDNATAYVYFNEIREEDKPILDYYINNNLIKIEENPVKNVTLIFE